MRIISLFLFLLLFVTSISAQHNYVPAVIAPLQRDSLRGFIDYRNWGIAPTVVSFKTSLSDDKIQHFHPGDIRAFRIAEPDETNVSRQVKMDITSQDPQSLTAPAIKEYQDTVIFIRLLVTGTYNLYVYTDKKTRLHYIYEASGKPESATDLEHIVAYVSNSSSSGIYEGNTYQEQLSTLFADAPAIAKRASRVVYREHNLVDLFEEYNYSKNPIAPLVKKKRKSGLVFGVMAGMSSNSYKFSGTSYIFDGSNYSSTTNPLAGVFMTIPFSRKRGQFALHNELFYKEVDMQGTTRDDGKVKLSFSYVHLNILFRYTYPKGVVRPFIDAGVGNAFVLSTKNNTMTRPSGLGRDPITEEALPDPRKHEQSLVIGAGVQLFRRLSIEARYASSNGMSPYPNDKIAVNSLQLIAGYRF